MCKSDIDSVTLVGRHEGCQFLSLQQMDIAWFENDSVVSNHRFYNL